MLLLSRLLANCHVSHHVLLCEDLLSTSVITGCCPEKYRGITYFRFIGCLNFHLNKSFISGKTRGSYQRNNCTCGFFPSSGQAGNAKIHISSSICIASLILWSLLRIMISDFFNTFEARQLQQPTPEAMNESAFMCKVQIILWEDAKRGKKKSGWSKTRTVWGS